MLRKAYTYPSYEAPADEVDYTKIGSPTVTDTDPANDNRDPAIRRHILDKRRRRRARLSAR